jgi:hypothetical protein
MSKSFDGQKEKVQDKENDDYARDCSIFFEIAIRDKERERVVNIHQAERDG